jgi:methionyl-tRNA synthetase
MKMAETHLEGPAGVVDAPIEEAFKLELDIYRPDRAFDLVFSHIQKGDEYVQETEPFKKIKSDNQDEVVEAKMVIGKLVHHIYRVAEHLTIFMPDTAEAIMSAVRENKKPDNLFPRLEA